MVGWVGQPLPALRGRSRWAARREALVAERCSRTWEDHYWRLRESEAHLAVVLGALRVAMEPRVVAPLRAVAS